MCPGAHGYAKALKKFQRQLAPVAARPGAIYDAAMPGAASSFDLLDAVDIPASPVVLSVPHGGRDYPLTLRAALRVPLEALLPLEDRHVDTLLLAARSREATLVQRLARAWIDLNRGEHERDWVIDDGAQRQRLPHASAKLRGGLG
ncbi:MAG: N-formylglutamate amidohydrolase, partial [Pseudomonadota bacterium]|nr:N-formylglutamate amidohydrolase [Pseudomonadota bacterium]